MTTQISSTNIQPATLAVISQVTITSITVTNSSWTPLNDSAVSTSGGFIVITGTNFATGCNVIVGSTNATSVSFVNSTTLRVQVPALSAGTYVVYVTNTNGTTAIIVNGLTYSGTPTWVTASPLPQGITGAPISIQLSATGDAPLIYALQAGSSLPAGLTLSSGGLLSGTVSGVTSETTYNFTIEAIDPQLQDSPKAFAITILSGDQFWEYVTLLLPGTTSTSIFNDDASTNNFPITIVGDTRPNNFNPYTPGYYSNFFDGTGDSLSIPSSVAFAFDTGNFTFEAWVYTSIPADTTKILIDFRSSLSQNFLIGFYGPRMYAQGGGTDVTGSLTFSPNSWTHCAWVRNNGTLTLYLNGVSNGSIASTNSQSNAQVTIGGSFNSNVNQFMLGYISNLRIVKGTALYTANFTPPTQPLTAIANTSLLTCQSNRFIDNSTNNFTITRNGDVTVNSFNPFVPSSSTATLGSTYFDGSGDYLTLPPNAAFDFGTGDFTVECWVYLNTGVSSGAFLSGSAIGSTDLVYFDNSLRFGRNNVAWDTTISFTLLPNIWYHVAFIKESGVAKIYVNGSLIGSAGNTNSYNAGGGGLSYINTSRDLSRQFSGYMSNYRIVKGTAVYTANFTPPTAPLTAIANTSLLTCQTNQPVENNDFLDSSTNNLIVTRNGNTTQGTFSPYAENWSNYFDGTGDYLTLSAITTSGDFTLEFWAYRTAAISSFMIPFSNGGNNGWIGWMTNATTFVWDTIVTATVPDTINTWAHYAIVRQGATARIYVNGVQCGSASTSANLTFSAIGTFSLGSFSYTGYLSNVRLVNGTAVYTGAFTPSTVPLQPIAGTRLLTCRDNSFVDDSASRLAITRNGDVRVQKFGPFAGTTLPTPYYGAYFDGTGDWLTTPYNAAYAFGTGDFTVEFWVNHNVFDNYEMYIGDVSMSTGNSVWGIGCTSALEGGSSKLYFFAGTSLTTYGATWTPLTNTWYHIAAARSGTSLKLFVNGTQIGSTFTCANNIDNTYGSGTFYIGRVNSSPDWTLNGYISNMRVVKGTALYTANFTPPTQPLTAIANTSLLTCQSATFIDNSTNNFAITAVGNSQPTFFNPFTVTYSTQQSYSPSVFGGSMYFDGTGDYLTLPVNTAFNFGTGDFTFECWFNTPSLTSVRNFINNYNGSGSGWGLQWRNDTGGYAFFFGDTTLLSFVSTPAINAWNHVAVSRAGTALRMFVNGALVATATNSTNLTSAAGVTIGDLNAPGQGYIFPYIGYISNLHVVKGQALYTSGFAPPLAPVQPTPNTVLLLNGTAGGIIDVSSGNNLETVGDARISTVQSKFGGSSMFFDGTGDRLDTPSSPLFNFGTSNFTVEFWINPTSWTTGAWNTIFAVGQGTNNGGLLIGKSDANTFVIRQYGIANIVSTATLPTPGVWTHVACVRNSGISTIYYNGVSIASASDNTNYTTTQLIGHIANSDGTTYSHYYNGYIQDFRITAGIARYTANFTPPTSPFLTN